MSYATSLGSSMCFLFLVLVRNNFSPRVGKYGNVLDGEKRAGVVGASSGVSCDVTRLPVLEGCPHAP